MSIGNLIKAGSELYFWQSEKFLSEILKRESASLPTSEPDDVVPSVPQSDSYDGIKARLKRAVSDMPWTIPRDGRHPRVQIFANLNKRKKWAAFELPHGQEVVDQSAHFAPDTLRAGNPPRAAECANVFASNSLVPTQGCRSRSRKGSIDNKGPCVSRRHFRGFEHSFISTEGDVGNSEDDFSTTLEHDPSTALGAIAVPRNFVVSTVTQFTGSTGHLRVFARRTCGTGQDDSV